MKAVKRSKRSRDFIEGAGRALRRAAKVAQKTARAHGTPIYVGERQSRGEETVSTEPPAETHELENLEILFFSSRVAQGETVQLPVTAEFRLPKTACVALV